IVEVYFSSCLCSTARQIRRFDLYKNPSDYRELRADRRFELSYGIQDNVAGSSGSKFDSDVQQNFIRPKMHREWVVHVCDIAISLYYLVNLRDNLGVGTLAKKQCMVFDGQKNGYNTQNTADNHRSDGVRHNAACHLF